MGPVRLGGGAEGRNAGKDATANQFSWQSSSPTQTCQPARRCANASTSCVRLSVTSRCSVETAEQIELVLACEFPSTRPTLCSKEIHVTSKVRVLPCGILLQTLYLENFATAYR